LSLPATPFISVIIPNHNGEKTIGLCLKAAYNSDFDNFEIVVVDDCSADGSIAIIAQYPCRLIRLSEHGGASKARNTGAQNSRGDILFFIDADCLLQPDTLAKAASASMKSGPEVVIGGTYTWMPYDQNFFSIFQSIYIHYSETKNVQDPDYIATHAMLIRADIFKRSDGFNEEFMPILEDVEYSHRLKKMGYRMCMDPAIQVQHIFNFTLKKSFRNGIRKTKYWSIYSIKNKDLLSDSGKISFFCFWACCCTTGLLSRRPCSSMAPTFTLTGALSRLFIKLMVLLLQSLPCCIIPFFIRLLWALVPSAPFSANISVSNHDLFTFSPPGFYPVEKKTNPVHLFFNPQV
jgi:glycosyltransferase involved in cell wall biosynthesis